MMEGAASRPIAFIDLARQRERIRGRLEQAIARVLDHCQFVMGPEVTELERRLAAFCGVRNTVTCASGTDSPGRCRRCPELHLLRHGGSRVPPRRDPRLR
jgi:hypothetical protein